jgi:hypothetical protein
MRPALTILVFFLFCSTCLSATIYVPDNYPTIQDAINASVNGDAVIVRPGTYVQKIDFVGKAIAVQSEDGPGVTVIDGRQAGSVVTFRSGEGASSVLAGFTVTNGYASKGGGIFCSNSSPVITKNIITANTAGRGGDEVGGGIFCEGASPMIRGNDIRNNWALSQDSDRGRGGSTRDDGWPQCRAVSVQILQAGTGTGRTPRGFGGGVYCIGGAPLIVGNSIAENTSGDAGGGIYCLQTSVWISGNVISKNLTAMWGGGGIMCEDSLALIEDNMISGNYGPGGGGLLSWGGVMTIDRNIIVNNEAFDGAGVFCDCGSRVDIYNSAIISNDAWYESGGVYSEHSVVQTVIENCTVAWNTAIEGRGGIHGDMISIANTIVWGNDGEQISGSPQSVSFCDVQGGYPGIGNIDADPLFTDSAKDDFHITWNSPCRNMGDNGAVVRLYDFEGDPRVVGTVDMGADEYYPHLYHSGEVNPGSTITLKAIGIPGAGSTLCHGSGLHNPPLQTPYGKLFLQFPLTFHNNGTFPATGYSEKAYTLPTGLCSGQKLYYQLFTGGRLWNLMTLAVE